MAMALAVEFVPHGTWHYLRGSDDLTVGVGDQVIYPTSGGDEVARVVWAGDIPLPQCIPLCPGVASRDDHARDDAHRQKRAEILTAAEILIDHHQLPMKALGVDYHDPADGEELAVVYYQAPERVDFRSLVSELARTLGSRVDLRQIAVRDSACLVSDLGVCGRTTCCRTWLGDLQPAQAMGLSPGQLTNVGMCGRPVCCVRYGSRGIGEEE